MSHIATDPRALDRFLALTGLTAMTVRSAATSPGFLASVLDFVLQDDRMVVAVADAQGVAPERVSEALRALRRRQRNGRTDEEAG